MMQKAYATFATVAQFENDYKPEEAVRSRWADQVSVIAQQHTKYIQEFEKGTFYNGIDRNPRLSKDSDEKVSLKSTVEETEQQKEDLTLKRRVTLKEDSTNVQQMDEGAKKLIKNYSKNFKDRFRAKKAAAKKAEDEPVAMTEQTPVEEDKKGEEASN